MPASTVEGMDTRGDGWRQMKCGRSRVDTPTPSSRCDLLSDRSELEEGRIMTQPNLCQRSPTAFRRSVTVPWIGSATGA
jgi:hypothetical protein